MSDQGRFSFLTDFFSLFQWFWQIFCKRNSSANVNDTDYDVTEDEKEQRENGLPGLSISNEKTATAGQNTNRRGKKRITNIYIPNPTSVTETFTADFSEVIKKMSPEFKIVHDRSVLHNEEPLIVVCPAVSRLEPDVDYALSGLQRSVRFAVIVLNMTRETFLPRLPIETRLDTKQAKYRDIDFIDVALTPEGYLYDCSMNTLAKIKLSDFFNRMYKK